MSGGPRDEWELMLRQAEVLAWVALVVFAVAAVMVARAGQVSATLSVVTGWAMMAGSAVALRRRRRGRR